MPEPVPHDASSLRPVLVEALLIIFMLALLALPMVVLSVTAGRAEAAALVPATRAAALEHLVVQDCGSCHGLTMKGGLGSPLTPEALAHASPDGLASIILDGIPGTAMPPWRPLLSEAEAVWIADYLLKDVPK